MKMKMGKLIFPGQRSVDEILEEQGFYRNNHDKEPMTREQLISAMDNELDYAYRRLELDPHNTIIPIEFFTFPEYETMGESRNRAIRIRGHHLFRRSQSIRNGNSEVWRE